LSYVFSSFYSIMHGSVLFRHDPLQCDIRNGFCSTRHTIQRCLFLLLYYSVCVRSGSNWPCETMTHIIHLLLD
jgi:hypothetical protein